jgi:hypothetical protein
MAGIEGIHPQYMWVDEIQDFLPGMSDEDLFPDAGDFEYGDPDGISKPGAV